MSLDDEMLGIVQHATARLAQAECTLRALRLGPSGHDRMCLSAASDVAAVALDDSAADIDRLVAVAVRRPKPSVSDVADIAHAALFALALREGAKLLRQMSAAVSARAPANVVH